MRKIEDREEAKRRQKESNRIAVAKYQEKFKRINCRLDPALYEAIAATGQSVNTFIIEACQEKLKRDIKEDPAGSRAAENITEDNKYY
jgi:predicted HicB family RNase H-like nuclease